VSSVLGRRFLGGTGTLVTNVNTLRDPAIYALHAGDHVYRYVGATTKNSQNRLYEHIYRARIGHMAPVYQWMREVGLDNVETVDLVKVHELRLLDILEATTIATLIADGYPLTNRLARDGRPGSMADETKQLVGKPKRGRPTWIKGKTGAAAGWTEERRKAQSERMKARNRAA